MGIEYSAQFVPFSQSRNKDKKDKSLNWTVTLKRNRVELTTDYMQGSGHVPIGKLPKGSEYWRNSLKAAIINESVETGKVYYINSEYDGHQMTARGLKTRFRNGLIPKPSLKEVLWCLLTDSDVLQHDSFESWASDFGYDTDSREAEKVHQACMKIALKINQMFSNDELEQLREFYQDY
jgi:hypothetical protein